MRTAPAVLILLLAACSTTSHSPSASTVTVLPADQTAVSGTITSAQLVDAVGPPLRLPLTITIPNRGQGELNIGGVVVNGKVGNVAWDGGQPLPLSGSGALDLGAASVDIDHTGATWHLDGSSRQLDPGTYHAGSSVAIGSGGLASPVDAADFAVPPGGAGEMATVGDAQVHVGPGPLSLHGPGRVTLSGTLTLRTATGTRTATHVVFGPGPFTFTLTPNAATLSLTALLQGPVSVQ